MNKEKFNFINKIKESKKLQIIVIVSSIALVFLFCLYSGIFGKKDTVKEETNVVKNYVSDLENKLSSMLSNMENAGKVDVIITVNSGMETVIAKNLKTVVSDGKTETVEEAVLVNGKTVVIKEKYPEISGVLVCVDGAKNISVYTKIQQAIISLLNVEPNKIEILTRK